MNQSKLDIINRIDKLEKYQSHSDKCLVDIGITITNIANRIDKLESQNENLEHGLNLLDNLDPINERLNTILKRIEALESTTKDNHSDNSFIHSLIGDRLDKLENLHKHFIPK